MRSTHPAAKEGKKIVVVVGAGFAGLAAAKELSKSLELHVIVVDYKNHHLFQPLLYQVATAGLNPADIAVPIRSEFSEVGNVEVHLGRLRKLNLADKVLGFEGDGELVFDYAILACGAKHSYFGKPEWEEFAPGLKSVEQATEIRRRILLAFENAENEADATVRDELLTFVIVGGGPTGVELAGAICDISQTVLNNDFKRINTRSAKVLLVEAGPKILASFDERLAARARNDLQAMGVEVRTDTKVTNIDAGGVRTADGGLIRSRTVIWAAGVQASGVEIEPKVEQDRSGRVVVSSDFSVPNYPYVFVVGDMAAYRLADGKSLPGLAPVAIQAGRFVARTLRARVATQPAPVFKYFDKGQMATIGRRRAIAQIARFRLAGVIAWLAWLFIHVLYLVGFKNKISVLTLWSWSYIFEKRGSRLITNRDWKMYGADQH